MNSEKQTYIEEAGLVFEKIGMTRMTGRVMGFMMICDKEAVSFDEIRLAIQVSKGSISTTMKQLEQVGFVRKVGIPGDRKTYYKATDLSITELLKHRLALFTLFSDTIFKALKLKGRKDDVSDWIIETAAFYDWFGEQMLEILEKWQSEKAEAKKGYVEKRRNV